MTIARDFSPRIERRPGGTVVLDVSGLQRLFGDPRSIAEHLARAGAPQVAIAASQTAAILLARTGRGVTVAAGDPGEALHHVPLAILQEFAAEIDADLDAAAGRSRPARRGSARAPRTFDVLPRWGLTTIGEFAALAAADLSARLGPAGIAHQRLARDRSAPLIPDPGVRRFVAELEWPIELLVVTVFARLLEPLAAAPKPPIAAAGAAPAPTAHRPTTCARTLTCRRRARSAWCGRCCCSTRSHPAGRRRRRHHRNRSGARRIVQYRCSNGRCPRRKPWPR
jgi:hypothetical protein